MTRLAKTDACDVTQPNTIRHISVHRSISVMVNIISSVHLKAVTRWKFVKRCLSYTLTTSSSVVWKQRYENKGNHRRTTEQTCETIPTDRASTKTSGASHPHPLSFTRDHLLSEKFSHLSLHSQYDRWFIIDHSRTLKTRWLFLENTLTLTIYHAFSIIPSPSPSMIHPQDHYLTLTMDDSSSITSHRVRHPKMAWFPSQEPVHPRSLSVFSDPPSNTPWTSHPT